MADAACGPETEPPHSIIAGVDPKVGLYASFSIAVIIAFTGGRPGMISAAIGALALLMVTLVKDHGLQ